jgi:hypothetical protein
MDASALLKAAREVGYGSFRHNGRRWMTVAVGDLPSAFRDTRGGVRHDLLAPLIDSGDAIKSMPGAGDFHVTAE